MHKTYLGDSVYAEIENGMVKLTTEDGRSATNTIFLEPEVLHALNRYVAWVPLGGAEIKLDDFEEVGSE